MMTLASCAVAAVWIFHGLYSKLLHGVPRHQQIVARVLGEKHANWFTRIIGLLEIAMGVWVLSGSARVACATVQTLALAAMNSLEIYLARDLLLSPWGMVALNTGLLALVWYSTLATR